MFFNLLLIRALLWQFNILISSRGHFQIPSGGRASPPTWESLSLAIIHQPKNVPQTLIFIAYVF